MLTQDRPPEQPLSNEEALLVDEYRRSKVRQVAATAFCQGVPAQLAPTQLVPIHQAPTSPTFIQNPITYEDPEEIQKASAKKRWLIVTGFNLCLLTVIIHPGVNQGLERLLGIANAIQSINPPTPQLGTPQAPLPSPNTQPGGQLPSPNTQPGGQLPSPNPAPNQTQPLPSPAPSPLPSPNQTPPQGGQQPSPPGEQQPPPQEAPGGDGGAKGVVSDSELANRVLAYFRKRNWQLREGPNKYNIAYIQTMDLDNTLNEGRYNHFDDVRLIFTVINGVPRVVGKWQATTKPGDYYHRNPMNPKGTAYIVPRRQYRSWVMGIHRRADHPALAQLGGIVQVVRVNGPNPSDPYGTGTPDEGFFGINQHGVVGANMSRSDTQRASAGCLVAQNWDEHMLFINTLRQDADYKANPRYVWTTGIIPGVDILKK